MARSRMTTTAESALSKPSNETFVISAAPRHLITPQIRDALLAHLDKNPELYLEEMVAYLRDEFGVHVTRFSVRRVLHSARWSKKKFRRKAIEQHPDLVDYYLHTISPLHSYQFVFVDESGSDNRDGFRRTGWSPRGVTKFHRGKRYQILPAYSQDGILLSRIFQGPTDGAVFEDFIEQLLHHCGRFPEPNSMIMRLFIAVSGSSKCAMQQGLSFFICLHTHHA